MPPLIVAIVRHQQKQRHCSQWRASVILFGIATERKTKIPEEVATFISPRLNPVNRRRFMKNF
jgi:hypothetical protein